MKRAVDLALEGHARSIDGFPVRRALPTVARRSVGPFVFFDHMGPSVASKDAGIEVRPHPHIGLATVTYLLQGEIMHRDSLGNAQRIQPGDINWMTAGRGIVHSERTPPEDRVRGAALHGLQLWVALPREHEEREPDFRHHAASSLPELRVGQARVRVLAGACFGETSPVEVLSPLFYADIVLPQGAAIELPTEHEERAAYVVEGVIEIDGERAAAGKMLVLVPGTPATLHAPDGARVALLGGAPLPERRFIEWNFVSTSRERIEQAKSDWREGRFPKVPGDEIEFVPLPG